MSYCTGYNLHLLDDLEMNKDKLLGAELRAICLLICCGQEWERASLSLE